MGKTTMRTAVMKVYNNIYFTSFQVVFCLINYCFLYYFVLVVFLCFRLDSCEVSIWEVITIRVFRL
jgi:hypothetical protein